MILRKKLSLSKLQYIQLLRYNVVFAKTNHRRRIIIKDCTISMCMFLQSDRWRGEFRDCQLSKVYAMIKYY